MEKDLFTIRCNDKIFKREDGDPCSIAWAPSSLISFVTVEQAKTVLLSLRHS